MAKLIKNKIKDQIKKYHLTILRAIISPTFNFDPLIFFTNN
jgi:hypothetical protein